MNKYMVRVIASAAMAVFCSAGSAWGDEIRTGTTQNPIRYDHHVTYQIMAQRTASDSDTTYRFHPDIYVAAKGDEVTLKINGLPASRSHVVLTGYDSAAGATANGVYILTFRATKPGIFPLTETGQRGVAVGDAHAAGYLVVVSRNA